MREVHREFRANTGRLRLPSYAGHSVAGVLAPGNIVYQLTEMTLLGHMRKRLKRLVECKFAIDHRGDSVLLDEAIHVFEIVA